MLIWRWTDLYALRTGLQEQKALWPLPEGHQIVELEPLTAAWRGVTPDGHRPRPIPPGRADRMFYLLQQIASTDEPLAGPVPTAVTLHRPWGQ
ncbi:hypothetical protein QT196_39280 (plasmid) [Streptomyces sp. P9-2B-2]|uniref:hypothetical protein n=1 Tax=Streptomyces sp. P9-2B-2 TaxID=3057114 RepID=UPI0025B2D78F|nr:hypothetical protein [Streptomyces sp. P9-2B-2]WJY43299.1 hypothetical protein QT196_39280 [Streptomyces sp. P9-2B-2]